MRDKDPNKFWNISNHFQIWTRDQLYRIIKTLGEPSYSFWNEFDTIGYDLPKGLLISRLLVASLV